MRALSLARPWATLLRYGKDVENRTWALPRSHVGRAVILHSSQRYDVAARVMLDDLVGPTEEEAAVMAPSREDAPTGYVAVAWFDASHPDGSLDCRPPEAYEPWCDRCSPWAMPGQHHWPVRQVIRFPEVHLGPGRLGLFTPPPVVVAYAASLIRALPPPA